MNHIEAMKQWLEALENSQRFVEASANAKMLHGWGEQLDTAEDAITSLRQAIAEAEKHEVSQEPVAWMYEWDGRMHLTFTDQRFVEEAHPHFNKSTPLYTTPPQRTWVGLTDEERLEAAEIDGADEWFWKVCKAIEAKLKEKNK
jgi:hypothetical protein